MTEVSSTSSEICHPEAKRSSPEELSIRNCQLNVAFEISCSGCELLERIDVPDLDEDRQICLELAQRCIVFRMRFPERGWAMITKK